MLKKNITDCFGIRIRRMLEKEDWKGITEIRVRSGKPLILKKGAEEIFINEEGRRVSDISEAFIVAASDVSHTVTMLSDYSLYAFKEQLRFGYVTVPGGHRAAIAGSTVTDNGRITALKNISSVSLRIANEKKGCSKELFERLHSRLPLNILIVSPVCGGKTTLLRDMIRIISDSGYTVGISDERGEIAACYMGVPQLDVGIRTDVLDSCPKAKGMSMLVRTMSPDYVASDEIGSEEDIKAIKEASLSGVKVICTAHGNDMNDIKKRFGTDCNIFDIFVFLEGKKEPGKIREIINDKGESICL